MASTMSRWTNTSLAGSLLLANSFVTTTKPEIFVLPVHEAENFFLHPPTLCILLQQNGRGELVATDLIREAADERAGSWIFPQPSPHFELSMPDNT